MQTVPCTYMRGGTSKGCVFLADDLPPREDWDALFVAAMGGKDPKQIDGLGGCVSSNNKIIVVFPSEQADIDVEYLVGQCVVGEGRIDYTGNCGNMTAVVAPFAIEKGLVSRQALTEPTTVVRLLNLNTNKRIDVTVPIRNGLFCNDGDCHIDGIEGTADELRLKFLDPAGSKTCGLFPAGSAVTVLAGVRATILDVSNPIVLVNAAAVGAEGTEMPSALNEKADLLQRLEQIRAAAACACGLAETAEMATVQSAGVPKIGLVSKSQSFTSLGGATVAAEAADVNVRMLSMGKAHKAIPLTAAVAIGCTALLPGTVVQQLCGCLPAGSTVRIANPSGILPITPEIINGEVRAVTAIRTARKIMEGTLYLP